MVQNTTVVLILIVLLPVALGFEPASGKLKVSINVRILLRRHGLFISPAKFRLDAFPAR